MIPQVMHEPAFWSEKREPTAADRFWAFHQAHPHVYRAFSRFALQALEVRKKIGAKMIWERMRWYTFIEARSSDYKLNNNYQPYYARLFMRDHPEHGKAFETRGDAEL